MEFPRRRAIPEPVGRCRCAPAWAVGGLLLVAAAALGQPTPVRPVAARGAESALAWLRLQEAEKSQYMGKDHPELKSLREQIRQVEESLRREEAGVFGDAALPAEPVPVGPPAGGRACFGGLIIRPATADLTAPESMPLSIIWVPRGFVITPAVPEATPRGAPAPGKPGEPVVQASHRSSEAPPARLPLEQPAGPSAGDPTPEPTGDVAAPVPPAGHGPTPETPPRCEAPSAPGGFLPAVLGQAAGALGGLVAGVMLLGGLALLLRRVGISRGLVLRVEFAQPPVFVQQAAALPMAPIPLDPAPRAAPAAGPTAGPPADPVPVAWEPPAPAGEVEEEPIGQPFELGPDYQEERRMREQEARQAEAAVLQWIFEDNLRLRGELAGAGVG
jgi:hypothetical protein